MVSRLVLLFAVLASLGWLHFAVQLYRTHRINAAELFPADHPLNDFYLYTPTFGDYHKAAFSQIIPGHSRFAYPPLVAPLYDAFYSLPHKTSVYVAITFAVWAALLAWASRRVLKQAPGRHPLAFLLCFAPLCFPAIFLLERGNLEIFVWAAVAAGSLCFARGRPGWAAALFGVATALKLYPVLLFGLLLSTKRPVWNLFLGVGTAAVLSVAAIWFSGPTFSIAARGFLAGVTGFQQQYGLGVRLAELRFDHSLFSVVKVLAFDSGRGLAGLAPGYYLGCAAVFASLFLFRVRRLPWLNQLVFLSVAMVLLPPVSYVYTLVHLYVPSVFVAVLLAGEGNQPSRTGLVALAAMLFLLLPPDVLTLSASFLPGQVQAVALLALAGLACSPLLQPRIGTTIIDTETTYPA